MLVSDRHKLVFVHIQKTGGSTIANLLETNIPDVRKAAPKHEFAIQGMKKVEGWDEYFKFAFVRNPWDRLVSWYSMLRKAKRTNNALWRYVHNNSSNFEEFVYNCTDEVKVQKGIYHSFAYNQLDYLTDKNGNLLVDYIGRFENFEEDVLKAFSRLGVRPITIPHTNRSSHTHYSRFYTAETEMIVRERFKRDIEYFGYEFERPILCQPAEFTEDLFSVSDQAAEKRVKDRVNRASKKGLRIMRDEEIKQKIVDFARWHYRFDLKGNLTPIFEEDAINRQEQRKKYFFDPFVELLGGTLAGKRVLDLGCNAGFWSLCAIESGCDYVLGIDGRQMHVDQANFVFEVKEVERDRYDFITGNIFDMDIRQFGRFDVVLCLGLMYHISKHVELMEKISEVNDDVLLIDTALAKLPGPAFKVWHERLDSPRNAVDHELVMAPTWEAVRDLVRQFGYNVVAIKPDFDDYKGSKDYVNGRRAFLCAKLTDVSRVPAEIEPASPNARPALGRRKNERRKTSGLPGERDGTAAGKLEGWLRQTDLVLSELFTSRRWRLANTLGDTGRRILGIGRGPTAEDRLLAIRNEFRAWLEESVHNHTKKGPE